MKLSKPTIFLALLGWLATGQAEAAIVTCAASATSIPFGSYDPTNPSDVTPTGSVSVTCSLISGVSLLVAYTITMSTGSSGNFTNRKMTGTATPMYYNLYLNGAWTQVWGDGTAGTFTKSDGYLVAVGNTTLTYTVYSKLPARQLVAAGGYSDNVVISVNY